MSSRHKQKKVLVVVHDAGGAEIIGAYMRKNPKRELFIAHGAGPAAQIFKRLRIPLRPLQDTRRSVASAVDHHTDVAYALLAAPGWMTKTEIRALHEAKKAGLKTVVYMDSWEDERKRFGYPRRGWRKSLPDEFWVGDTYAYASIRKEYPDIPVHLVPNHYFANELERYRTLKRTAPRQDAVLFVSQDRPGSHELLGELLRVLGRRTQRARLRIRYHPVDDRKRYDALIRSARSRVKVIKSREKDLVKDLLHARVVVGTETGAMAVSVLCRIPTISLLGKDARPMLPYPQIKRIHNVKEIGRLMYPKNA